MHCSLCYNAKEFITDFKEIEFMAWYDEAVFYHIYPLGLTGAPKQNDYGEPVHRLNTLLPGSSI